MIFKEGTEMDADAETFRLTTAVHHTATASNQSNNVSHLRSYQPYSLPYQL